MVVYFAVGIPGNESSPEVYLEYHIGKNLWKYCSPVMIVLGTIGNIFSIVVLLQKSMRRQTTVMYLVALSFNDMAVLYIGLLRYWILATFEIDVRHFSEFLCKVHIWLVYVTVDTSAWILVVVSFERLALVWYPHITKSVCTRTTAISILVAVVGTLMLINSHIMYGIGDVMKDENNQTTLLQCFFENEDYQRFYVSIWPWIDLAKFNAIPFSIILFCNICILSNLYKRKQKLNTAVAPQGIKKSKVQSLTITLIALNTTFLISSTPVSIYLAFYETFSADSSSYTTARLVLAWAITNLVMFMNNTINFLLYCVGGENFRRECRRLLTRLKGQPGSEATVMQSTLVEN